MTDDRTPKASRARTRAMRQIAKDRQVGDHKLMDPTTRGFPVPAHIANRLPEIGIQDRELALLQREWERFARRLAKLYPAPWYGEPATGFPYAWWRGEYWT